MLSSDKRYLIWQEFCAFGPEQALEFAFNLAAKYELDNIGRQHDPVLYLATSVRGLIGPHRYVGFKLFTRKQLEGRVYDILFIHNQGLKLRFWDEVHDPRTFRNHRLPNPAL